MEPSLSTSAEDLMSRFGPIFVGTQYYRAPTPTPDEWGQDLEKIAASGLDGIQLRLQWRWVEPKRDVFRFDDHDRLIRLAEKHGLKVIVKFIVETAPDYVYRDLDGTRLDFLGAPIPPRANGAFYVGGISPDFNNPQVIERARHFVNTCVLRYRNEAQVQAWHLWNEPRSRPAMDHAGAYGIALFQESLRKRFGTIEAFNAFFGKCYEDFAGVRPDPHPGNHTLWFLWRRFCAERVTAHLFEMRDAARSADTSRPCLIHSGCNSVIQMPLTDMTDDVRNAQAAERYGTSLVFWRREPMREYVSYALPGAADGFWIFSLQCDWMRCATAPHRFWVNEIYPNPYQGPQEDFVPEDIRRQMYEVVSRGGDGILFWQYREERLDNEIGCAGFANINGDTDERWTAATATAREFKRLAPFLENYRPAPAVVAIHHDPETDLLSQIADPDNGGLPPGCNHLYKENLKALYTALWQRGVRTDFTRAGLPADPTRNRVWIAPDVRFITPALAKAFISFVTGGGILIAGPGFGERDENLWVRPTVPTPALRDLFGAQLKGFPKATPGRIKAVDDSFSCDAGWRIAEIAPDPESTVLINGYRLHRTFAAGTVKRHGLGAAVLLGFYPGAESGAQGLHYILREVAGIHPSTTQHLRVQGQRQAGPDGSKGVLTFHFYQQGSPIHLSANDQRTILVGPDWRAPRPASPLPETTLCKPGDIAVTWDAGHEGA